MKRISILGSTGSIGTQALDVIRHNRDRFSVVGLSANRNVELLYQQIAEFKPLMVCVTDQSAAKELEVKLADRRVAIVTGAQGLIELSSLDEADTVLTSVVGIAGLCPTLNAIEHGKDVALANKETLVAGGPVIKKALASSNSKLVPVDSEHCAVFQCLQCTNNRKRELKRILLTASGGPFRGRDREGLKDVTVEQALKHPRWNMGRKISIDSATLMNKGLEIIEAHWLFDTDYDRIDVVIHPESIIHSMVEYIDGSIIAQLGPTDMRNPILYALSYPERINSDVKNLDLIQCGKLTFEKPDLDTFRCMKLAYDAGRAGGTMPAVLNAANEVAVDLFLRGVIEFLDIPDIVERTMTDHINITDPDIDDILEADSSTRERIYRELKVGM